MGPRRASGISPHRIQTGPAAVIGAWLRLPRTELGELLEARDACVPRHSGGRVVGSHRLDECLSAWVDPAVAAKACVWCGRQVLKTVWCARTLAAGPRNPSPGNTRAGK